MKNSKVVLMQKNTNKDKKEQILLISIDLKSWDWDKKDLFKDIKRPKTPIIKKLQNQKRNK